MSNPTLEKACSDVALDACAHNRRLAKSAISTFLASWSSTIEARLLNYGPLAFVMHPSPVLATREQVYHTRPLMSRGSDVWLALLPSLEANYLSTIGFQPQPPFFLADLGFRL